MSPRALLSTPLNALFWIVAAGCAPTAGTDLDRLDLEAPRLLSTDLPDGPISTTRPIRIRFSEPLDVGTVNTDTVVLVPHEVAGSCTTDISCPADHSCYAEQCQQDRLGSGWISDLASPPLGNSRRKRLPPYRLVLAGQGDVVQLEPLAPLPPLRRHTLLVGPGLTDRAGNRLWIGQGRRLALQRVLVTGGVDSGRATVWLRSPAAGTADLPRNLARVVVRFSRPVPVVPAGALGLGLPNQQSVATALRPSSPRCQGLPPGTCYELELREELPARTVVRLWASPALRDRLGRAVLPPLGQAVATGDQVDLSPPAIGALRVQLADGCVTARLHTDEAADLLLTSDWGAQAESSVGGTRHEVALRGPVRPGHVSVTVRDLAGNAAQARVGVEPSESPRLALTEVLANPLGKEPAQELLELLNLSPVAVDLAGWELDDGADGVQVRTLPSALLQPGQYAVVVGQAYQESTGPDPAPDPGAVLVRLPGLLGASGLSNAGEAVTLRDPQGHTVSSYGNQLGAISGKQAGNSVERVAVGGCDVRANWRLSPNGPSPGRAPAPPP